MKKFLFAFVAMFGLMTLVSCSEDTIINNYDVIVENQTVNFQAIDLVTEQQGSFGNKKAKGAITEYLPSFPLTYTAYFVSKETKGQYTQGQLVATLTVNPGNNTISVPKLNMDIYVSNFTKAGKWYEWNDAIEQLPQSTSELYLYGKTTIDYKTVTSGSVNMINPYAAVLIKTSNYIPSAPMFYNDSKFYVPVTGATASWHMRYLRATNTNTLVPLNIAGNPNTSYTLSKTISANNIYLYTLNGDVNNVGGDFEVVVLPFDGEYSETIDLP